MVRIGAYVAGNDPMVDWALEHQPAIHGFLRQAVNESSGFTTTVAQLQRMWQETGSGQGRSGKSGKKDA